MRKKLPLKGRYLDNSDGEVLFEKLKLTPPKKTKTGEYSTGIEVLEDLAFVETGFKTNCPLFFNSKKC